MRLQNSFMPFDGNTANMSQLPSSRGIPPILHVVNIVALLLGGLILLLTAVSRPYQLVVLLPVLVLLVVYWRLRQDPRVAAGYFGLALALAGWIIICENIVTLDNALGTELSRSLHLSWRLQSYVNANLHTREQKQLDPCCDDPLTWHYRPGSLYRATFDCATCGDPYEVVVDETGYLNQQRDVRYCDQPIDLFLAGDSVLQGIGVPSVVEWLRPQLPLRMWNLSVQGYGPRQKVSALIAYALPKQPRWLIVEFHAGNDLRDAIADDVCESVADFRCRYNEPEVRELLAHHPVYQTIFDHGNGKAAEVFGRLAVTATHNLTLATTRHSIDALKGASKAQLTGNPNNEEGHFAKLANPAGGHHPLRQGQVQAYLRAGLTATLESYERLEGSLEAMSQRPTVILLYNPTPYELYRELRGTPRSQSDLASDMQRETLRVFADIQDWQWLDLTEPFRQAVLPDKVWLYGRYDRTHYSPQGTTVVATVLAAELQEITKPYGKVRQEE